MEFTIDNRTILKYSEMVRKPELDAERDIRDQLVQSTPVTRGYVTGYTIRSNSETFVAISRRGSPGIIANIIPYAVYNEIYLKTGNKVE